MRNIITIFFGLLLFVLFESVFVIFFYLFYNAAKANIFESVNSTSKRVNRVIRSLNPIISFFLFSFSYAMLWAVLFTLYVPFGYLCEENNITVCTKFFEYAMRSVGNSFMKPSLISIALAILTSVYFYIKYRFFDKKKFKK